MIRAVTFDFWETLVSEGAGIDAEEDGTMRARQLRRWSEILGAAGTPIGDEAIDAAFDRNWEVFHEGWRANVQHGPAEATPLICEILGVDPTPDVRAELLASFDEVGRSAPLRLAPGVEDCIRRLKEADIRIGIVCDVGMTASPTLRERLDMFGVLRVLRSLVLLRRGGVLQAVAGRLRTRARGPRGRRTRERRARGRQPAHRRRRCPGDGHDRRPLHVLRRRPRGLRSGGASRAGRSREARGRPAYRLNRSPRAFTSAPRRSLFG